MANALDLTKTIILQHLPIVNESLYLNCVQATQLKRGATVVCNVIPFTRCASDVGGNLTNSVCGKAGVYGKLFVVPGCPDVVVTGTLPYQIVSRLVRAHWAKTDPPVHGQRERLGQLVIYATLEIEQKKMGLE